MYTLYGTHGSGSAAVEAALTLCQAPFQMVEAATWIQNEHLNTLRQLNPLGQVPTLQMPDGTVMSESAAILIELAHRHPGSGLLPSVPQARARVLRGLVYVAANCYAAIGVADYPERWLARLDGIEDAQHHALAMLLKRGAKARLHQLWDHFAEVFGEEPLGRASPDALDILATVVSKWSGSREHLAATHPALLQRLLAVETHPLLASLFQRHWPGQQNED